MSRVLLTGASGFVGRSLVQRLVEAGEEVHALRRRSPDGEGATEELTGVRWHDADLLDTSSAAAIVEEVRPQRLAHLAWYVAHGRLWSALENVQWVEASLRLLRAFGAAGGERALIVGSCAEYAWGGEDDLDECDSPLRPEGLYGVCKDALRRVAGAYADAAGVELAWGRLFFLYGPHEQTERLVPAVIRPLLSGERVATTLGTQVRDFMHVDDAAGALAALLDSEVVGPVNIASGRAVAIAEVLDLIGELTGAGDLIDRGARPLPPAEPPRIVAQVRRLATEVGFEPQISLREGLASTVEWWRGQATTDTAGVR